MDPAELFAGIAGRPLPQAAAQLAAEGLPVFPCVPGGKRPLVEHGFHEATTDARQVTSWWRRWPRANVGVPTGHASGLEVVDVDQKASGSGFEAFDRAGRAGLLPGWLALVRTPSGGAHFYFPADPYRAQPSWQAARAHVDFRGSGGYVIVPPSVVVSGGRRGGYELAGPAQPHTAAVDARALRDFLDPRPQPALRSAVVVRGATRVEDAQRLAGWVSALGEGERNRGLFWAACRLAEAGVAPSATLDALGPAAEQIGLPPREVVTTIRSAYRATSARPALTDAPAPGHGEASRRPARAEGQVLS
jgi:hypothetical protein